MRIQFLLGELVYLARSASSGGGLEIYDGFNINLTLIDLETVKFDIVMKEDYWLGLNLGVEF